MSIQEMQDKKEERKMRGIMKYVVRLFTTIHFACNCVCVCVWERENEHPYMLQYFNQLFCLSMFCLLIR